MLPAFVWCCIVPCHARFYSIALWQPVPHDVVIEGCDLFIARFNCFTLQLLLYRGLLPKDQDDEWSVARMLHIYSKAGNKKLIMHIRYV